MQQTFVLGVNINCNGCKSEIEKVLSKTEGVHTSSVNAEQGKVTVTGNVDPAKLIEKLGMARKHAELCVPENGQNCVNVHKDSLRVVVDEFNSDSYLVSFTYDARVDGCFTIFYFAKEGVNCTFMPVYPEIYMPRLIHFKKGLCQKFCQQSQTGIDLGFFELDHLSNPSPNEDIFPLVISAEAFFLEEPDPVSPPVQITQAVLKKTNGGQFQAKVIKQILWVDGVRYELKESYAIGNSGNVEFDNDELGKECIICMTLPMNITYLPCRHMCLCSKCAKDLRLQSNECPICRQPIEVLLETFVLRVNIQCNCIGCNSKIKVLRKTKGVHTSSVNAERGTVTVIGNIDPAKLVEKLKKAGKHAELC